MSSQAFREAVSYALRMVGKADLLLKREQLDVMEAMYNGRDAFLLLPNGYGKSIML